MSADSKEPVSVEYINPSVDDIVGELVALIGSEVFKVTYFPLYSSLATIFEPATIILLSVNLSPKL